MGRALRVLKARFINWLFKDVELDEFRVRKIKAGERTIVITPDYVNFALLTEDPALAAGRMWFNDVVDKMRFSPDGVEVVDF